jgi:UDP-glucose 4-epimerase
MNILIIGAAGFIGSHLADYLSKKHNVTGLDNFSHACGYQGDYPIVYGDVRYLEEIEEQIKNCDIIYHLAAQINVDKSILFPQETFDINIQGTKNVLDCARKYNKIVIFASTSEVYGEYKGKIKEDLVCNPQSPYAVSKLCADKLCQNYYNLYGVETYIIRCFNVFGPRQSSGVYGAVIPIFADLVKSNKPPTIFGSGKQRRDYIYVSDVVRAYELIPTIKKLVGKEINVATGKSHSINEVANLIIKLLEKKLKPVHVEARKGEVMKLEANISKIKKYGWKPLISFKEGLKKCL